MGKSAGSAPPAPDPVVTARAQTESNQETARTNATLNRVNQYAPQGSITYRNLGDEWARNRADQMQRDYNAGTYNPAPQNGGEFDWGALGLNVPGSGQRQAFDWNAEYQAALGSGLNPNKDQWEQRTTLSPEQQRIYDQTTQGQILYGDAALQQLRGLKDIIGTPVNFNGAPARRDAYSAGAPINPTTTADMYGAIDPTIGYGAQSRARVEDALFQRLQPQLDRQRAGLETNLRAQGLAPGSEAWTNSMRDLGTQENDARLGVIAQGGQEEALQAQIADALFRQQDTNRQTALRGADQVFQQQLAGRQLGMQEQAQGFNQQNALRDSYIQELLQQRQIPLQEAAALLGGNAVQYPQYIGTPQSASDPTNVLGAYQQQQQARNAQYQAAVANASSGNAAAAGLGSAALMAAATAFSDERLKENVERVGKTDDGQPIYIYNYKGDPQTQMGLMAQDVEKVRPEAVFSHPSGFKKVDYRAAASQVFRR